MTASKNPGTIRTYVLDTSVLLSDPWATNRFAEHEVVIPLVVISELEGKRHHHELGWFARTALRMLDDLRLEYGRLDQSIPVGTQGGSLRVELNHTDPSVLPVGFRTDSNDSRILACALNLAAEGKLVTLVSKDIPLRVKAGAVGLAADEYRAQDVVNSGWTGMTELDTSADVIDSLFESGEVDLEAARDLPCHTGVRLLGGTSSALGRVNAEKRVQLVRGDREVFGLRGRSAEQRVALDILLDESVGIVSLGGKAGTGKSALALCAGLEAVLERRSHRKVVVFRPLYAVGGQELGYLPGSESEKMGPWAQAVFDTLEGLASPAVIEEVLSRGMLEVLPLTHIRGRSLHDSFVIVDEAQSLERNVLLTVLSRLGTGSRVVLTHDVAQRDNLRVGRHDGVAAVIEKLKGHPLFAHVTLVRSERSPIAALVTEMLEEFGPGLAS
ncbi:Probable PhoH-like protein PhoH2 (phosphate starvation-inducible protein PsiH) [Mycobacteroides abscessus subsp. bolletii]|uniref:Protein PhoH2 n=1 Tax=Mycobacteroides abscessus subsp. bolletii TaxID=319705 RepID=A0A9Q7WHW8_9MYCO|nr:Probable PhoH-like protein PhoH2 (phosphate starvation-inducible protein PsiH) [Mycobacteroides abscessus]SHP95718.1 Probable PhoH-like protein PhoH2 (phosphate starvation-inducible protein PsiH) [Mycobacteroides abscessus subsp. bolletii]BBB40700.1 putative PhoH-like protein PhoH2 [Mycobacteroides abscessus subsp. bolletii BD]CPS23295.1 Probable PhoH-like protein PhoH2 (phosphate starvation-inducible protein PsiH) [Mycobacteroides abscessus]CPS27850.1 Probable PhoH-like protein PhoH2 (phosp